jgi:hypothetical protein
MAVRMREQVGDLWSDRGLGWIEPDLAFAQLERLLADRAIHAVVLPIDWIRFLSDLPKGVDPDFFEHVAPASLETAPAVPRHAATTSVVDSWRAALPSERRRLIVTHLSDKARHVLDVEASTVFDERLPLKEVGLDSLLAVELRNVLTRSLGTSLPATLLFDHPSLEALTQFLVGEFGLALSADVSDAEPIDAVAGNGESMHDDLVDLTDQEAEAVLLAELGEGGATDAV